MAQPSPKTATCKTSQQNKQHWYLQLHRLLQKLRGHRVLGQRCLIPLGGVCSSSMPGWRIVSSGDE